MLLASSSFDSMAYEPVRQKLNNSGYPVIIYRTDQVLSGEDRLFIGLAQNDELVMRYNDQSIAPDDISAAWYRKVAVFDIPDNSIDLAKNLHIHAEVRAHHETIWSLYPDDIWLNAPDKMRAADRKLGQLIAARDIGFSIPETVVASRWDDIETRLLSSEDPMIVKMIQGVVSDKNNLKALFTTVIDQKKMDIIRNATNPFPGIYQNYLAKHREWRLTVVGDRVFAASIYTDETAQDDWRKLQETDAVIFKSEQPPEDIAEKCIQFLAKAGLTYGAFDFIEKRDGETIFLECNPNGQYGWLEDELGFPISEAIAEELIKIANQR